MDIINIGNDIRVDFKLKDVKYAQKKDLKDIKCFFIKCCHNKSDDFADVKNNPFPQYYNPTEYTIHSCGFPTYNVMPHNNCNKHCSCGFSVNSHSFCYKHLLCHNKAYGCNIPNGWNTNQKLSTYFSGRDQFQLGEYRLIVCAQFIEKNWGYNDTHQYLIDYGVVFKLDIHNGLSGNIVVNLTGQDDTGGDVYGSWYIGQITATKSQFTNLTDSDLINNAIEIPLSTKSETVTLNKSCWYVLIPTNVQVLGAKYVCGSMISEFSANDIVNRTDFDVLHDDIIVDNVIYKVYAYRSYAFTNTPALSTFNIE